MKISVADQIESCCFIRRVRRRYAGNENLIYFNLIKQFVNTPLTWFMLCALKRKACFIEQKPCWFWMFIWVSEAVSPMCRMFCVRLNLLGVPRRWLRLCSQTGWILICNAICLFWCRWCWRCLLHDFKRLNWIAYCICIVRNATINVWMSLKFSVSNFKFKLNI